MGAQRYFQSRSESCGARDQGRWRAGLARPCGLSRTARRDRHRHSAWRIWTRSARMGAIWPGRFHRTHTKERRATSRVRSAYFEMELDHDTGAMRGRVLAGRHQGADLERLDVKTLSSMLTEIDDESRALLIAYLDRRDPTWSEYAQTDTASGRHASSSGKMSEQEAYQVL